MIITVRGEEVARGSEGNREEGSGTLAEPADLVQTDRFAGSSIDHPFLHQSQQTPYSYGGVSQISARNPSGITAFRCCRCSR